MDVLDLLDEAANNTVFYQIGEDKVCLKDENIRALIDIAKAARTLVDFVTIDDGNKPLSDLREALKKLGGGDE